MTLFTDLGLAEPILRALKDEGYDTPTPIQARAIPSLLEGRDILGIAQTGTGKTAAFALPILNRLISGGTKAPPKAARVLIMAPTRELAAQIGDSFRAYGRHAKITVAVVVGGVSHSGQVRALARGVDVLVATPGRLLDHVEGGTCRLDHCEVVVLDEADHMLDLGFVVPIRKILAKLPSRRQSLFFSATMPREIATLAGEMLREPVKVEVTPVATTAERVAQQVYLVEAGGKRNLLIEVLSQPGVTRTLVFTRTKRGADRVSEYLEAAGIASAAIHGNKSQGQRERALDAFKSGRIRVLVATDIAARGIDVEGVTHVVNFELPNVPESYVHRIGRTARAGAEGIAISFCDGEEQAYLRDIEKVTRQKLPVIDRRANPKAAAEYAAAQPQRAPRPHGHGGRPQQHKPHQGGRPQQNNANRGRSGRPGGNGGAQRQGGDRRQARG